MKLYEIRQVYEEFMNAVECGDVPQECINDTLEAIQGEMEDKIDNIACLIKSLIAETEAMKAEKKTLDARMKTKTNLAERLKEYVADTMKGANIAKIETARNKLSFRKSNSVFIKDEAEFVKMAMAENDALLRYKNPEIDKEAVKNLINDGIDVPGAEIRTNYSLQIK